MITLIENLPPNMVGFRATEEVTEDDFKNVVMPNVKQFIEEHGNLNYMLILDTSIKNFSMRAWMQDAVMGLKHISKWHHAAIITDIEAIKKFTEMFSLFVPGVYKAFDHDHIQDAIDWTSEKTKD